MRDRGHHLSPIVKRSPRDLELLPPLAKPPPATSRKGAARLPELFPCSRPSRGGMSTAIGAGSRDGDTEGWRRVLASYTATTPGSVDGENGTDTEGARPGKGRSRDRVE